VTDFKHSTIEVSGSQIRTLEGGAGPSLIYLHGIDGPRVDPLMERLARTHRIIAPELPGFGRSPLPEWMNGISDAAYFGLDFIEALRVEKIHLVGHSIGGWVAAEMAIRQCALFASLTLIAPMGVQIQTPAKHDVFIPGPDLVLRAQFFDQARAEDEIAARAGEDIDIVLQNRTGLARLGWTPRFANVQLPQWLHRVRTPTLLLWGEDDGIVPVECCDVFEREIAGARAVRYPKCGHALPYERSEEAARELNSLMAGARR
jgi:pimeloyl-ACP methyl ester carboxylesterase